MNRGFFEVVSSNYIGTPIGFFHTDLLLSEVKISDLLNENEEGKYQYTYKVSAFDNSLSISQLDEVCLTELKDSTLSKFLGFINHGIYYEL